MNGFAERLHGQGDSAGALVLSGDRLAITSVLTPGLTPVGPFEVGAVDIYERVQGTWTLADTLMPEAYEHGGPAVAISTAAGFVLSFVLSLV